MKRVAFILEYILVAFFILGPLGTFVLDFWGYYCEFIYYNQAGFK